MVRSNRRKSTRVSANLPPWIWFLSGLLPGLLIAVWIYVNAPSSTMKSKSATAKSNVQDNASKTSKDKQFDFYTLLPELEVVMPDASQDKPRKSSTQLSPIEKPGTYVLQVGSFRKLNEADSLKANLALLGVEANIETVKVNKDTWHRVRVGPYTNLAELNRTRRQLRQNDIDSLLMRVRN